CPRRGAGAASSGPRGALRPRGRAGRPVAAAGRRRGGGRRRGSRGAPHEAPAGGRQ
ncbi:unnamed protein product, partial [Prorocentrum cordatum]